MIMVLVLLYQQRMVMMLTGRLLLMIDLHFSYQHLYVKQYDLIFEYYYYFSCKRMLTITIIISCCTNPIMTTVLWFMIFIIFIVFICLIFFYNSNSYYVYSCWRMCIDVWLSYHSIQYDSVFASHMNLHQRHVSGSNVKIDQLVADLLQFFCHHGLRYNRCVAIMYST